MEMINPPCSVNEIINHFFNYENLQKYLDYLLHLDKRAIDQIYELRLKFEEISDVKQDIAEIKFKLNLNEKQFEDMNTELNNHQLKLIEVENQATSFSNKIQTLEVDSAEYKKKIIFFDENLKNLNKVTEDNCKSIEKINSTLNTTKNLVEVHAGVIDSHEKTLITINKELNKLMNLEDSFVTFKEKALKKFAKIKRKNSEFSSFNVNIQNKIEEVDFNLSKLSSSLTDISKLLNKDSDMPLLVQKKLEVPKEDKEETKNFNSNEAKYESVSVVKRTGETLKTNLADTKADHGLDRNYVEFKELKQKVDKLYRKFDEIIGKRREDEENRSNASFKNEIFDIENKDVNQPGLTQINQLLNTFHDGKGKDNNSSMNNLLKMINVLTENQKALNSLINNKVGKDDLENSNKHINHELEGYQRKLNILDEKVKKFSEEGLNNTINKEEIISILKKYGKEIITLEITNLISKEIDNNDVLKNINSRCESSAEEISKLYESIVDIRRHTLEEKRSDPQLDDKLNGLNVKMDDLEYMLKYLKTQFDENFKGLEEEEQNNNDNPNLNLKDLIRNIKGEMRGVTERIDKVVVKQDNLSGDLLGKIKKDLAGESNRILEEFRSDLKNSIGKIDEQLQHKVDHILLDDFGKRIDNKLANEISKKIDKNDLKKNNTYISKKIDNLENKISRTLVDTLIDLQLEEAPLIVKKGMLGDKCASCNQIIQFNPSNSSSNTYTINVSNSQQTNNNQEDNGRYKLRTIQDNSYKYGTGSYSRVLSNANPNTLNEDLKLKNNGSKKYINTSVQLPDINNTVLSSRKMIAETPVRRKELSLNKEDKKDQSVGSLLSEELEKKILKPDNLIKASNKYFDNIDKKSK